MVRAAWNIFGDSYRYRQQYNAYKAERRAEERRMRGALEGQQTLFDLVDGRGEGK